VRLALIATAVIALAAACASPGMPPGGPTKSAFPRVIASLPETSAVNARPNKVLLRYDDVIGEQANGADLYRSVLISPWDGEPRVDWKRTGMTIRPHNGWRANTAYTITVLPGITDFRGKASPYGYEFRFSTGPTIPNTIVRGVAFDWAQARAIPKATIQAIDPKDTTLVWLTVADSTGRYEIGAMPAGTYVIRAIDEKTPNRVLDSREPWDTATVTVNDSARADLYLFVHDTLPVRVSELRSNDSVTINMTLDKPLRPGVAIPVGSARVVLSDSTVIPVVALLTAQEERAERAKADSLARAKDTTAAGRRDTTPRRTIDPNRRRDTIPFLPPPVAKRAAPANELVLRLGTPLKPGSTYRVTVTGLQNLLGVSGTASRLLIIPKPTPIDSTRNGPPGARRPGGRDSTSKPPAPGDSASRTPVPAKPPARPPL
jgi:Bacterial Ig-like domain